MFGMNGGYGYMNTGGHMGNAGGFNYGSLINGLLMLLVNIIILVLVIAVIAGIIVWVRNNMLTMNNSKVMQTFTNDPVIRVAIIITTAVIGFVLLFALLNNFMGTGMGGFSGYGMHNNGINMSFGVTGLIMALVRVLMFLLVVSLVIAAMIYIRDQYNKGTFSSGTQTDFQNVTNGEKTKTDGKI
ncbi:MAG: hypothetical protein ACOZCL_13440 [Bacillota bacterium]